MRDVIHWLMLSIIDTLCWLARQLNHLLEGSR